ncbi:MAG: hypothetical protein MZV64_59535 [Ignavibacteriales bacterium]|nr:hypothetical protein [Ignavibacteriales bacterium]
MHREGQKYFIVQFSADPSSGLEGCGDRRRAEILYYLPDFAFKVRMNPGIASRVEATQLRQRGGGLSTGVQAQVRPEA